MTKLLIINYFFGDARIPTGRMVNDICEQLKNKNVKFKVFSSGNKYKNIYSKKVVKKYEIRSPSFTNLSFINYILFFISVLFHVHKNNYQKFLILTDPPFLILISPLIKFFKKKNEIIYWTMDLYPEALYASKIFPFQNRFVFNLLKSIKNYSLKYVDKMINLSESQNKILKQYRNTKKIITKIIHPWDLRDIKVKKKNIKKFLTKYNLTKKKIILYAGNIGAAHSVDTLIELINFSEKKNKEFYYIFACIGKKKQKLLSYLRFNKNVLITNYFSNRETSYLLNSAFCHLVTLEDDWAGIVYPSKIFGIIKTKKPIIYIGPNNTDIDKFIRLNKYGKTFRNSEKPSKILESIEIFSKINKLTSINSYSKNPKKIINFILN